MKNHKTLRLKFISFFVFLFSISILNSQTVHPGYLDGHIWFKLKNTAPIASSVDLQGNSQINNQNLNVNNYPFLVSALKNIDIINFSRPYFMVKEEKIKNVYRLEVADFDKIDLIISQLNKISEIEYAEKVPLFKKTLTPNDPSYNSSNAWGLYQIQASTAWDVSVGNSNIIVAIVDDAVEITHSDLSPAIWTNPGEIPNNGIDDDNNGYVDDVNGFDVADDDNDPNPDSPISSYDHGTHVAGIAGAATNNNTGIASIGFGVSLLPVKATNSATAVTHGYDGVIYAVNAGAHVINMSWGGSNSSTTGQNIVDWAYNQNIVLVGAAGNDDVSTQHYPAAYSNVIAVASTTVGDAKSGFSNYGSWIDISAPGSAIYSTIPGNGYATKQGTSMASPMVAGLCGLMLSLNPTLPPSNIKSCLLNSADNIDAANASYVGQLGAGRINALAAMNCISATLSLPPTANFSSNTQNILEGQSVTYTDLSTYNPQTWSWTFPGGSPASFIGQTPPPITYNTAGTYNATLIVTNSNGTDTEVKSSYIVVNSLTGCDTISNTMPNDQIVTWTWGAPNGYIGGHNFIKVKSIADKYSGLGPTYIMGASFYFTKGETTDPNSKITVTVWDDNAGEPGTVVYTEDVLIQEIVDNINGAGAGFFYPTNVNFDTPVIVTTNDFYIGYQMTYSPGDTVSCALTENLNTSPTRPNTVWYYVDPNDDPLGTGGGWINIENLSNGSQWSPHIYPRITQTAPTAVITSNSPICEGEFISLDGSTSPNAINWDWIINGTNNPNQNGANPSVIMPSSGSYTSYLIAYNSCGFYHVDSIVVDVNPSPNINITASADTICPGNTSNLTASGAATYSWSPSATLNNAGIPNPVASPANSTTYTVVGSSSLGCTNDASISIVVDNTSPVASFIADNDTICEGDVLNLNGAISSNASTYNWTFNGANPTSSASSSPSITYPSSGTFVFDLVVSNTCSQTDIASGQVVVLPTSASACSPSTNTHDVSNESSIYTFMDMDRSILNVVFDENLSINAEIEIINTAGQLLYTSAKLNIYKGDIVKIDISNFSNGMYFLNVKHNYIQDSIKFIK